MTPPDKSLSCEDVELCLADMIDGELEPGRMEAFLAHVESCEACRNEWRAWREQDEQLHRFFARERVGLEEVVANALAEPPAPEAPSRPPFRLIAWAAAALAFVALGGGAFWIYLNSIPQGERVLATVRQAEGSVQVLDGGVYRPLAVGAELRQDQRLKVGEGGYAALEYPNHNLLEVRAGTQLALREFRDRTEVAMNRGQVWAHLKQKPKKPFIIATTQLRATATGTVYSVQEGISQTVVAVAEGTVKVEGTGIAAAAVKAGDIFVSRPEGETGPVSRLTDWSRHAEDLALLAKKEAPQPPAATQPQAQPAPDATPAPAPTPGITLQAKPAPPQQLRDLLDALPDRMRSFIAIRNWPRLRSEFGGSAYAALTQDPRLREWWAKVGGPKYLKELNDEIPVQQFLEIFSRLDGQVVAGFTATEGDFILMADCRISEDEVRARIGQLVSAKPGLNPVQARQRAAETLADLRRHFAVAGGRILVSSNPALLTATLDRLVNGKAGKFKSSDFYKKVAANQPDQRLTAAIDMNGVWPEEGKDKDFDTMTRLTGLRGIDYFLVSPSFVGHGLNQAARIGFNGPRYGMMNWLAEPGPMRGYDFFSGDVHFFFAARLRSPRQMFFDYVLHRYATESEESMRKVRAFFDQHEALFDAFGGEVAVGVDNPVLPVPNVKIAVELTDRPAFEKELGMALKTLLQDAEAKGKMAYTQSTDYKGRKVYSLFMEGLPIQPAWAYVDDYVVAGPGPQFVQDSIDVYASGQSIGHSGRLTSLFPSGSGTNFSLLVYQDVAKAVPGLLKGTLLPKMPAEGKELMPDLSFMERYRAPGIAYANAWPQSIDLFLNTPTGIDFNMGMAVPLVANWLAPHLNLGQAVDRYAEAMVGLEAMKAAAEKFHAATGRWPSSTTDLAHPVGKYIDRIPEDPFGTSAGMTLRLAPAPNGQGVILYSIGPDGQDQRGQQELRADQDLNQPGDIVLRAPESAPATGAPQ